MICSCVSVDTGRPECGAFDAIMELPLASAKTLWEAKTREEWEFEYSACNNMREIGIDTLGMLIEAYKRNDDPTNSRLLDHWNGRADNLGSLLNIVASMA